MRRCFVFLLLSAPILCLAKAERVISLAPHTTELAYAAGLGDKLIAASDYSNYPPQAQKLEKVANYQGIKVERILELQPDLVIVWRSGNSPKDIEKLKQFGINLFYSDPQSLEDIAHDIEKLSAYAEFPQIGYRAAQDFKNKLIATKTKYQKQNQIRYFYQLSSIPLMTVSRGKWPSEVFSFCGGQNIFSDADTAYPQVSVEQIAVRNPEIIFTSKQSPTQTEVWQKWSEHIEAIKQQQVVALDTTILSRPTPRVITAIEKICHHLSVIKQKT
jgi:vitamin B12 transport system substrate-binding protein